MNAVEIEQAVSDLFAEPFDSIVPSLVERADDPLYPLEALREVLATEID